MAIYTKKFSLEIQVILAFSLFALGFLLFFIVQDLNFDNLAIHIDTEHWPGTPSRT